MDWQAYVLNIFFQFHDNQAVNVFLLYYALNIIKRICFLKILFFIYIIF